MLETRQAIIQRIRAHLPFGADPNCDVREDSVLADLGVDSLHLITLMLTLQEEFSFDTDGAVRSGLPTTIGDLVALVESGSEEGPRSLGTTAGPAQDSVHERENDVSHG